MEKGVGIWQFLGVMWIIWLISPNPIYLASRWASVPFTPVHGLVLFIDKLLSGWFTTDAMDGFVYAHVQMQLIYWPYKAVRTFSIHASGNDITRREMRMIVGKDFPFEDGKPVTLLWAVQLLAQLIYNTQVRWTHRTWSAAIVRTISKE